MIRDRSKWHQRERLIRLCRHRARQNLAAGGDGGTAWRCFLFLVDKSRAGRIAPPITPLAKQCTRARSYLTMQSMGWREARP